MKVISSTAESDIARVYIAEFDNGKSVEFVESVQPPFPLEKKWVLIVSTLFGCPVKCPICDAGGNYEGKLSAQEIMDQIDFLVQGRFPDCFVPVVKFKVQFARMGDPAFNSAVIDVLKILPDRYHAPGLMPCVSTVAPYGCDGFFKSLLEINHRIYMGKFQLQFSIHSTDEDYRNKLIPVKKWSFRKIAEYGLEFYKKNGRKITLNFALSRKDQVDPDVIKEIFDPEKFMIKVTPVNPTYAAIENKLVSAVDKVSCEQDYPFINILLKSGYDVVISIGELEENKIGSNCGQYIRHHLESKTKLKDSYSVELTKENPFKVKSHLVQK